MPTRITPLTITASSLVSAAGRGKQAILTSLVNATTGLSATDFPGLNFATYLGQIEALDQIELEATLQRFNCRNNKLAKLALDTDNFREFVTAAIHRYGSNRIGVFMGTSTSGIAETELAFQQRGKHNGELPVSFDMLHTHNIGSLQNYVQHSLALDGAGLTISTACSSSAKVFATAYRFIHAGLCDAAVVGGVDSLCLTTLYGFNSLQLISAELCRPWDVNRNGINIGEAGGFALLEKVNNNHQTMKLKGFGESSDAYHMSTPHMQGKGANMAMQAALARAGLAAKEIDYINLHGTATLSNDSAEAQGVIKTFPAGVACSSTKGITGHTLGAAGITEAVICSLVLEHGILPGTVNLLKQDTDLPIKALVSTLKHPVNNVMSNSFGFGGSNCSLVLGW